MGALTYRQAFDAMTLFLDQYYERAGDDLLTLMADLTLLDDGEPQDPAAWEDWLQAVQAVLGGAKPKTLIRDDPPST